MTELEILRKIVRCLEADADFTRGMRMEAAEGRTFESLHYWEGRRVGASGMCEKVRRILRSDLYAELSSSTSNQEDAQ